MKWFVIFLIHSYRWLISPFTPPSCRFEPTCSRYAINCIEIHGLAKGLWLTIKRLLRCHPYSKLPHQAEKIKNQIEGSWNYPTPKKQPIANKVHRNQSHQH
jgi:uncharacterized protein